MSTRNEPAAGPPTFALTDEGLSCRVSGLTTWRVDAVACRDPAGRWSSLTVSGLTGAPAKDTASVDLPLVFDNGLDGRLRIEGGAAGATLDMRVPGAAWCGIDLAADEDEHYLGFGERFNRVDQRGNEVQVHVANAASGAKAYKPVPFFISSKGYGVHVATDRRLTARMAVPDAPATTSLRAAGPGLALRFYHGDPRTVLSAYTADAGRPPLPPAWVFGPWKSRDWTVEDQRTVLEDVRAARRHDLACSVKLIDAKWETAEHTFEFDEVKYPDVEAMIRETRAAGMRLVLWVSPWIVLDEGSPSVHAAAAAKGYLIRRADGSPYVHRLGNSPDFVGSCIDFTNPEAVRWWQANIKRLVALGVDGFKTDFGEQVPEDAVFHDGTTGAEMHNVYPRLYNSVTYEAMQSSTDGVLLARSAWHGSQALSAVWAGDQTSDFAPATGLESVIRAGQNAAVTGFPYWASDVGGYFGVPTDEVFVRWAQFGAFSPIMQVHGMGKREPWRFEPATLAIYRDYAQLHTDLFPYLYRAATDAAAHGVPIMRPLAYEFPGPDTWGSTQEHQYMFGDSLLVAPVYAGFNRTKGVWLPPGTAWYDLWSGRRHPGGKVVVVDAPLERIPVFVREGSLLPLLAASPRTLDCPGGDPLATWPDLDLLVYPGRDATCLLTDGTMIRWHDSAGRLDVSASPRPRQVSATRMDGAGFSLSRNSHGARAVDGREPRRVRIATATELTNAPASVHLADQD